MFVILLLLLSISFTDAVSCSSRDDAIVELYADWGGAISWPYAATEAAACGAWSYVTCDLTPNVISINIPSSENIQTTIPEEIGCLAGTLTELRITSAGLTGTIPTEVGDLVALVDFDLNGNRLFSTIPTQIELLTDLTLLDLNNNNITGNIPFEIGTAVSLRYIDLSHNLLEGIVPWGSIGSLTDLTTLSINNNDLTGLIGSDLFSATSMINFNAQYNRFFSALPYVALTGWASTCEIFRVNQNTLSGTIPTEFGLFTKLKILALSRNSISGVIPTHLGGATALEELFLNKNLLTGTLPTSDWATLVNLRNLQLGNNNGLSGTIPNDWFSPGPNSLEELGFSSTQITGPLPDNLFSYATLTRLVARGAQLTGSFPTEPAAPLSLAVIDVANNAMSGTLPPFVNLIAGDSFDFSGNNFEGTLPVEWADVTTWNSINVDDNDLSGTLPTEYGNFISLTEFSAANNLFTGSLPTEWANLFNAQLIDLSNNRLSGPLPPDWAFLVEMRSLDLGGNLFTGGWPVAWPAMTFMEDLVIKNNQVTGTLPTDLNNMHNLVLVDFSNNRFNGSIPGPSFSGGLETLNLAGNDLTGSIDDVVANTPMAHFLNFAFNELSGTIPSELGGHDELVSLMLHDNGFTGVIPEELRFLNDTLEELFLQNNQLNGPLPDIFLAFSSGYNATDFKCDIGGTNNYWEPLPMLGVCANGTITGNLTSGEMLTGEGVWTNGQKGAVASAFSAGAVILLQMLGALFARSV